MMYEFQLTKGDLDVIRRLTVAATYVAVNQKTENTLVSIVESTVMIEHDEKLEFHRVANMLHVLACARYDSDKNIKLERNLKLPKGSLKRAFMKIGDQADEQDPHFSARIMTWYNDRQQEQQI